MAVAKFKVKIFSSALELENFVKTDVTVASVITVATDNDGKLVLVYLTT